MRSTSIKNLLYKQQILIQPRTKGGEKINA
jgi:hypothetical protein